MVKEHPKDTVIFEDGTFGESCYVSYESSVRISNMFDHIVEEA